MSELRVRVHARTVLAAGIAGFELRALPGQSLPPFSAGAHIDVWPVEGLVRQYSLCNDPAESHRYQIAVLRAADSRGGSIAMHEQVQEGDLLRISPPRNLFALQPAPHTLLIAGGIGITPLMAMAHRLEHEAADFELHYCGRQLAGMACVDALKAASFADRVHFHVDDSAGLPSFQAEALLSRQPVGTHLYVCGPSGFMDWVLDTARRLGWPAGQLHREYFASSAPAGPQATDESFEVRLARNGLSCRVAAGQRVIDVLAAHGVDIPVSCEAGVCGTCLTTVLEGEPDHRDSFLTEEERQTGRQFTPCCSRALTPVLVLDL
ncbi:PDR/VanB family oxidoreductase [Ideonella sp.]|uniref:PDR/VanB family oxidoreductase n=1 Tax=Ideonella sp. TaxID=1929293 RepID=UPI003BB51FCC